jgi:hypothetical protein
MIETVVAMWVLFVQPGTRYNSPTHSQEFTSEGTCEEAKKKWLTNRHELSEAYAFCTRK